MLNIESAIDELNKLGFIAEIEKEACCRSCFVSEMELDAKYDDVLDGDQPFVWFYQGQHIKDEDDDGTITAYYDLFAQDGVEYLYHCNMTSAHFAKVERVLSTWGFEAEWDGSETQAIAVRGKL